MHQYFASFGFFQAIVLMNLTTYTEHQSFEINKPIKIELGDLVSGLYFIRVNQQSFKFIKSN